MGVSAPDGAAEMFAGDYVAGIFEQAGESFCRLGLQGDGAAFATQLEHVGVEFEEAEAEMVGLHGPAVKSILAWLYEEKSEPSFNSTEIGLQ